MNNQWHTRCRSIHEPREQPDAALQQRKGGGITMKPHTLQLVIIGLENGLQGVFVGLPLIPEKSEHKDCQVQDIWFSDVQEIPNDLTLEQLLELLRKQICNCNVIIQ
jgi:hypothetical protein